MNIAMRKLAMIEKNMIEQEKMAEIQGYTSCPVDRELKNKITFLMDKVRQL